MVNKAWIESMIEAFKERIESCECPFEKHTLTQEMNNYKEMLKNEQL